MKFQIQLHLKIEKSFHREKSFFSSNIKIKAYKNSKLKTNVGAKFFEKWEQIL